ncbi:MAG: sulfotransferase, partial [Planctomycetota bacterium]
FGECRDIVDFFDTCVKRLSDQEEGRRFVEKTPQHALRVPFILRHFPKAQIVHIIRDGRDAFASAKNHPGVPQGGSVDRFARYWKRCVSAVAAAVQPSRILEVRYETLCSAPEELLSQTMNFLDAEFNAVQIDQQQLSSDPRSKIPEFARLASGINSSSVGRWKDGLSQEEIQRFDAIAGRWLETLGYERTT